MAENSLQNQKNEVSFVLSKKAKTIIKKFEKQIENRSENDKNELRIDLLMLLLRRLHPEVLSSDTKSVYANLYRLNNSSIDKNIGFLLSCFEEDELSILGNEFSSIWNYYLTIISIAGITTSKDYQNLLLCIDIMPDEKRKLVLDYSAVSLFQNLDFLKDELKAERIQDKVFDTHLTELVTSLNTLYFGHDLKFDTFMVSCHSSVSISNLDSFVEFFENNVSDDGTVFVMDCPSELNTSDHLQFRKWVVDNKFLHGVIEMDDASTFDEKRQVLILNRHPADSIFFARVNNLWYQVYSIPYIEEIVRVIAEKDPYHYKEVSFEEFKAHNNRYYTVIGRQFVPTVVADEGETIVTLGDLVDLYDSEVEEDIPCFFLNRSFYLDSYKVDYNPIEAAVIPQARRVPQGNYFLLKLDEVEQILCSYIAKDNIDLLNEYSSLGIKYKQIHDTDGNPIICTYPNAMVFKLKETPKVPIDTSYLASLLSPVYLDENCDVVDYDDYSRRVVQEQLECYRLPYFSMENEDFLSIVLAVPSIEEQRRLVDLDRQKALADSKEEIKKNFESYRQDIRMKKHALAQRLRVMKGWWTNLKMVRENGNGVIDDTATIGQLHPIAVKDIFGNIDHEMNMLFKQVNSFNMGDTMEVEVFDAKDFIQQYVNHHDPMFEYQCQLPNKPANIRFPKEAFQIILDNISSNACSHGFKGWEKGKNIIRIIAEIKGQDLIIRVDNNGRPMPVGMTAEKVFTYGDTTEEGSDEHGGLGGYQIKDLMTKFGGEVELLLDEEADFPVAYKLVFRDVNIYK
ncbi:MAG: hypothetical protein IKI09_11940 [Bacteroidales bacterium]|nr:hypothetical protein [Bacteroidales bacterium]